MNCIYCHQGKNKPVFSNITESPLTVAKYFPEVGKYKIVLYGGEPLLYWDFLVEFCSIMKSRNPNVDFSMASNGTLLSLEKSNKLNELGVAVTISHDGKHHETTRKYFDILKKNPMPYLNLHKRSIASTITSLNYNFYDVWDYFEQFRINHGLQMKEEITLQLCKDVDNNTPRHLFIYNNYEWEKMLDGIFDKLYHDLTNGNIGSYECMQYMPMINKISRNIKTPENMSIWCGMDKHTCDIDIHGNLYYCHNQEKHFDSIKSSCKDITGGCSQYRNDKTCLECDAYIYCGGGCHVSNPEKRKYSCYIMKHQVSRVIDLLMKFG